MNTYVLTQKNAYVPENEVFFAYSLPEGLRKQAELQAETEQEWVLAVVLK
jgi:hypothetical protein